MTRVPTLLMSLRNTPEGSHGGRRSLPATPAAGSSARWILAETLHNFMDILQA
jgi:hypothetical protein